MFNESCPIAKLMKYHPTTPPPTKTLNVFSVNNFSIGRQGGAARSVNGVGYEVMM